MSTFSLDLPGWDCPACHVFNGEAKEERFVCRACDVHIEKGPYVIRIAPQEAEGLAPPEAG